MPIDVYFQSEVNNAIIATQHTINATFIDDIVVQLQNDEIEPALAMRLIQAYRIGHDDALFSMAALFGIVIPMRN